MSIIHDTEPAPDSGHHKGLFATLGLSGALLVSACCIVPLVLVTLGISGAWIGNLTALAPYKPLTSGIAIVFIGLGFWQVYFRSKPVCVDGASCCAKPQSARITKTVLWAATLLVLLSLTLGWWAPLFY